MHVNAFRKKGKKEKEKETSQIVDTCSYGCMQNFLGVSWAPKRTCLAMSSLYSSFRGFLSNND